VSSHKQNNVTLISIKAQNFLSISMPVVFSRRANYEYDSYFERYPLSWVFTKIFSETRSISATPYAGVS